MGPGRLAILLLVSLAVACSESRNLTGKWVVEKMLPAPGGAPAGGPMMDVVLDLHQEGTALTGTLVGHMGDVPISSGTVNG